MSEMTTTVGAVLRQKAGEVFDDCTLTFTVRAGSGVGRCVVDADLLLPGSGGEVQADRVGERSGRHRRRDFVGKRPAPFGMPDGVGKQM